MHEVANIMLSALKIYNNSDCNNNLKIHSVLGTMLATVLINVI